MEAGSERGALLLTLNMEEGGHKPGNVDGLQKKEKARKRTLPWSPQKGTADTLILAQ